jgi:hypothetical protein
MQSNTEPMPCPDCGHLVYRPLVASVRHPQNTCRAMVEEADADRHRCGCPNAVHRAPAARGRHLLVEAV